MKQKQIITIADALNLADTAIGGATSLGETLGIKQNTAAAITADKGALVTARNSHEAAKAELDTRQESFSSIRTTAHGFVTIARDTLKRSLGTQHSTAWSEAGFARSLEVPRSSKDLKVILGLLDAYLTAHSDKEVGDLNITAAHAAALATDLSTSENALNAQKTAVRTLIATRNAKFVALTTRLRGLAKELGQLLGSLDPRWLTFGFNLPGAQQTPDVPQNVTVVLVGPNAAAVRWVAAPRAEYYRVWIKVNGVDQELRSVGSPADLDFTIEELPTNSTIEIAVSAVNNGGESGKSTVVTVTTH